MKKISIGSWAFTIGPYAKNPIPWDEVITKLAELGFDGVELGGFPPHPNPNDMPEKGQRDACKKQLAKWKTWLVWSGGRFMEPASNRYGRPFRLSPLFPSESAVLRRSWHSCHPRGCRSAADHF